MSPLALLALGLLQLRPQPSPGVLQTSDEYGAPRDGDLGSIANEDGNYQRMHVRTRGRLGMVSGYYSLSEGGAQVLLLLGHGLADSDVKTLLGAEIEARGVVRRIRTKEYVGGMDKDLIEDPHLPPLPAPHVALPRVSLTLLGFSSMAPPGRSKELPSGAPIAAILKDPASFAGKPVVIVGQFRGRNLFGDLPEGSQRTPNDWVIRAGEQSAWVTEKLPKGKGFTLDLGYKGDASRWLEVVAKPEVVNGIVYLRASKVGLAQRQKKDER